jgi:hypothetical protein
MTESEITLWRSTVLLKKLLEGVGFLPVHKDQNEHVRGILNTSELNSRIEDIRHSWTNNIQSTADERYVKQF